MPPANRDASELTRKRRAMALYAFNTANSGAVTAGYSVQREQSRYQTLDVVTARQQGGCYCAAINSSNGGYDLTSCGCGGFNGP
jgi:hypothetical protein